MHQTQKYTPSTANLQPNQEEPCKFVDDRHGIYNLPKRRYKLVLPGNGKELEYTKTHKRLASRKCELFLAISSLFFFFPFVIWFCLLCSGMRMFVCVCVLKENLRNFHVRVMNYNVPKLRKLPMRKMFQKSSNWKRNDQ